MFASFYPRTAGRSRPAAPDRKRPAACRPRLEALEDRCLLSANVVLEWNQLALEAIGQTRTNPVMASRALTITQLAVYDAVNAIDGTHAAYAFNGQAPPGASAEAAAASAAYHTLVELFPTRRAVFDAALESSLATVPDGPSENEGVAVGRAAARSILALRRHDGSDAVVAYTAGTEPGDWQPTPPAFLAPLAPHWPDVTPFAMTAGSQFRPPPPPDLGSEEYADAFNEVKVVGAANAETSDRDGDGQPDRTAEQTQIARFWGGGTGTSFAFGAWNQIAQVVATNEGLDVAADARLFAVLNLATADAIISCWDAKYEYDFWRPVTAIRAAADVGSPDATWTPLLTTPNFPGYTSAHSTVSSAAAAVLTSLFDEPGGYAFSVGSEGLPGVTRSYGSFDEAAREAGQSRIYGGIHFQFDNQAAQTSGRALGQYVLGNFLLPVEEDEGASLHDAPTGGRTASRAEGPRQAGPSDDSPASWFLLVGPQSAPATGQRPPQPTEGPAAPSDEGQPIQHPGTQDRLETASDLRALDQVFADLDDGTFADPLPGDEFFTWGR